MVDELGAHLLSDGKNWKLV